MPMDHSHPGDQPTGPITSDFIAPPDLEDTDKIGDALPAQEEFWLPPVRFGAVPVEKEPLGWDRRRGFRKIYPQVMLPFQVAERVKFGHARLEPNRLFWGDNLHVIRQLRSESIDLIYVDPPFFSGRQYNVIFRDRNELRSFSDIWEGGMPGYLIWLNARLYEMKRVLKKSGSIYVHCDWHASHYIKIEMDKLYGYNNLRNEIIWYYNSGARKKKDFGRRHDVILRYSRSDDYYCDFDCEEAREPYSPDINIPASKAHYYDSRGKVVDDVWRIPIIPQNDRTERIGYPTQKPETLLSRIVATGCPRNGTVADFFVGGGTTAAVAQRLGRRWVACDQSRVAVAITRDRLVRQIEHTTGTLFEVPDLTVEHWGVYEAKRLSEAPPDQFRGFVLRCFGARDEQQDDGIHGYKGAIPVWVGGPAQDDTVTAADVQVLANAIRKTLRYQQDNLRDGFMLAWGFRPDAVEAADRLRRREHSDLNFIRLDMVRIGSPRFRKDVAALSTAHADYENILTFVQPPRVEIGSSCTAPLTVKLDVSETIVMNAGAKIINVQWDFDYDGRFRSTPGYSFVRSGKKEPPLKAQYRFPAAGRYHIACKVQDDMGGEGLRAYEIELTRTHV